MASYYFKVKSRKKGNAAEHSRYITREGKYHEDEEATDLVATGSGNLPEWTNGNPIAFWKAADRHERVNGAACREFQLALPRELTSAHHVEIVEQFIEQALPEKPHEYAIHSPTGALSGEVQPHAHVIFSDRVPDGIERDAEQMFRRYNPVNPSHGGCRKDSGGKSPLELRDQLVAQRKLWADIQNTALEKHGHAARVDHRSYRDQGIEREPEHHLGQARIRNMSEQDKAQYIDARTVRP